MKTASLPFAAADFQVDTLEDEIHVDALCCHLLRHFYNKCVEDGETPEEAGKKARGADYFLRDFMIADRRKNIFEVEAQDITAFAGNWYIVRNLEPNMAELQEILAGVDAFYRFCRDGGCIGETSYPPLSTACGTTEYYRQRIDSFWEITDDGYFAWNAECPLVPPRKENPA